MKKLLVMLLTLSMVLALAGCGQSSSGKETEKEPETTIAEETTTKEMPTEPEIETLGTTEAETAEAGDEAEEGIEGTYVFGIVNAFGSTVPYVLCLKEGGDAAIIMDNSFTGARTYTGTWEGEDEITIKLYTWEGDNPFGDFFDADSETYDSTWTLDKKTQSAKEVSYEGATNPVSIDSLSDDAKARIDAFMEE